MDKEEKYENEYAKDEEKSEERKQGRFLCQYNMKGYQIFAIFVVIFAISIKRMLIARTTERKKMAYRLWLEPHNGTKAKGEQKGKEIKKAEPDKQRQP